MGMGSKPSHAGPIASRGRRRRAILPADYRTVKVFTIPLATWGGPPARSGMKQATA